MSNIFFILLSITLLFFGFLFIKGLFNEEFKKKFCVICFAVSFTWISLIILYWMDLFKDRIIIALLIGQTILGIFYLAEKKVKEKLTIFRLPFLLTLTFFAYLLLEIPKDIFKNIIFLLIMWGIFIFIYLYKNNKKTNYLIKKLMECCGKW